MNSLRSNNAVKQCEFCIYLHKLFDQSGSRWARGPDGQGGQVVIRSQWSGGQKTAGGKTKNGLLLLSMRSKNSKLFHQKR